MPQHHSINYIELPLTDVEATKTFYGNVFGWTFHDYGPDYQSFSGAAVDGGFNRQAKASAPVVGVLVVLYSSDLDATLKATQDAGAKILKAPSSFPGGRRFHFIDPNNTEIAVWTE
jgi:predicted enzyme related to lactoylglutathione lyase